MFRYSLIILFLSLFSLSSYSVESSITAGTTLKVRIAEPIDSRVRKAGYRVKVTIDSEVKKDGKVVIKSGSKAQALINKIHKGGRGSMAPEIILTLIRAQVNNRQTSIQSFAVAGKGTTAERKNVGEVDENENIVISRDGTKITTSIPIITTGYDMLITEGTIVYFILKEPIAL